MDRHTYVPFFTRSKPLLRATTSHHRQPCHHRSPPHCHRMPLEKPPPANPLSPPSPPRLKPQPLVPSSSLHSSPPSSDSPGFAAHTAAGSTIATAWCCPKPPQPPSATASPSPLSLDRATPSSSPWLPERSLLPQPSAADLPAISTARRRSKPPPSHSQAPPLLLFSPTIQDPPSLSVESSTRSPSSVQHRHLPSPCRRQEPLPLPPWPPARSYHRCPCREPPPTSPSPLRCPLLLLDARCRPSHSSAPTQASTGYCFPSTMGAAFASNRQPPLLLLHPNQPELSPSSSSLCPPFTMAIFSSLPSKHHLAGPRHPMVHSQHHPFNEDESVSKMESEDSREKRSLRSRESKKSRHRPRSVASTSQPSKLIDQTTVEDSKAN